MTSMKLEYIILSEISDKEKKIPYDLTPMWNLRNKTEDLRGREGKTEWEVISEGEKP